MELTNDQFEEVIVDFCNRIFSDFENIKESYNHNFPDASAKTLAANLMEFGREQISEIEESDEKEKNFIEYFVNNLSFKNENAAIFQAYSAGCIIGFISSKQLVAHMVVPAVEISALVAMEKFEPKASYEGKNFNMFLIEGPTAWQKMKNSTNEG